MAPLLAATGRPVLVPGIVAILAGPALSGAARALTGTGRAAATADLDATSMTVRRGPLDTVLRPRTIGRILSDMLS
jgi:hypothetical protein